MARQLHAALHLRRCHAPLGLDRDSRAGGKNITQIDLDTAQSPALLAMGLGLVAVGVTLAALVFANWSYTLSVAKSSVAAAASFVRTEGPSLVYASREVRLVTG